MNLNFSLEQIVAALIQSLHPEAIICYGSFAAQNHDAFSDIDLLVFMQKIATEIEHVTCYPFQEGIKYIFQ